MARVEPGVVGEAVEELVLHVVDQSGEPLDALGVRHGALAVTRTDLADPADAMAQARAQLAGTSLGDVAAVASARGVDELRAPLDGLVARLPAPVLSGSSPACPTSRSARRGRPSTPHAGSPYRCWNFSTGRVSPGGCPTTGARWSPTVTRSAACVALAETALRADSEAHEAVFASVPPEVVEAAPGALRDGFAASSHPSSPY